MFKIIIAFMFLGIVIYAQDTNLQKKIGSVTFITPQNVYLKFDDLEGITPGDTLYHEQSGKAIPVISVKYVSSMSCAGEKIGNDILKVGDQVFVWVKPGAITSQPIVKAGTEQDTNLAKIKNMPVIKVTNAKFNRDRSNFYGSFNANSFTNYTNFANTPGLQRWNYTLNLNANKIGGSSIYFSNYMNLAYMSSEWQDVKANVFNNLRIYDLSLGYKTDDFNMWLGRHINYNISNIGPVDGLMMEKSFGNFSFGGVAGSRPDLFNMGFNFKYFEYGAYINRVDSSGSGAMQNTVALFQQTYNQKTDRRFLYLQHTNNLYSNINFFASSEIDLYKQQNNIGSSEFSLTSLYMSMQYTPIRLVSVNLSYDARKNVVYYESFKSFIDSLFDNEMRQGLRLSFFLRPFLGTFINLGGGYSYQKGDLRPSRNFNVSITQSEIPLLDISATISANKIIGSYQNGSIYGISLSKFIPFNVSSITLGFSNVTYDFGGLTDKFFQKEITAELSTRLLYSLFFNIYYEGDFAGTTTYNRFMSGINYRF